MGRFRACAGWLAVGVLVGGFIASGAVLASESGDTTFYGCRRETNGRVVRITADQEPRCPRRGYEVVNWTGGSGPIAVADCDLELRILEVHGAFRLSDACSGLLPQVQLVTHSASLAVDHDGDGVFDIGTCGGPLQPQDEVLLQTTVRNLGPGGVELTLAQYGSTLDVLTQWVGPPGITTAAVVEGDTLSVSGVIGGYGGSGAQSGSGVMTLSAGANTPWESFGGTSEPAWVVELPYEVTCDDTVGWPEPTVVETITVEGIDGSWTLMSSGAIVTTGDAQHFDDIVTVLGEGQLNSPPVALGVHPAGTGYWIIGEDAGVFAFGAAVFYGSLSGIGVNEPVVDFIVGPSGTGYVFVTADGNRYCFGDTGSEICTSPPA